MALELSFEQRQRLLRLLRRELGAAAEDALADGVSPKHLDAILAERLRSVRDLGGLGGVGDDGPGGDDDPPHDGRISDER